MKTTESKLSIYLLLILLILAWSGSWPIAKIGLTYMSPLWFSSYRLVLGTLIMFMVVGALGRLVWPGKEDLKIILTIGILQVAAFLTLISFGLHEFPAGRSAILVYTTPIWVVPISIFFFKEKANFLTWLGVIFGIVGMLILFNPVEMDWSNHKSVMAVIALLGAALSWAIAILCARYMTWPRAPIELIAWQLLAGTIPVVLITLITDPHLGVVWNRPLIFSIVFSAVFATALAYWCTIIVSKSLSPIVTSISLLVVPVLGFSLSAFLLAESITWSVILSMMFIVAGLLLCVVFKPK